MKSSEPPTNSVQLSSRTRPSLRDFRVAGAGVRSARLEAGVLLAMHDKSAEGAHAPDDCRRQADRCADHQQRQERCSQTPVRLWRWFRPRHELGRLRASQSEHQDEGGKGWTEIPHSVSRISCDREFERQPDDGEHHQEIRGFTAAPRSQLPHEHQDPYAGEADERHRADELDPFH